MFDKTCWDGDRNRYACRERADYINPKSHVIRASLQGLDDAQTVDCTWLTAPHGKRRPRQGGDAALRHAGAARAALSRRRLDQGRDRRPPGGGGRRRASPTSSSSAWATASPRARAIRTCRCASRPTAPPTTASAANNVPLNGYPARIGDWKTIGEKAFIEENARWLDQACHRSLYSHQLRAALQLAVEDPHRAVTFVGVACSGAETVFGLFLRYKGHEWVPNPPAAVADLGRRRGAVRRPRAARLRPARGLPHEREAARAEGRPRAQEVRCRAARARSTCCCCRSAATTSASRGWSPMPCWPTRRCCAGSAAGSARCTASPRPARSSTRSTTA